MSEISNPEAFRSHAQKIDLNALADAFTAKGDYKEAQRLREQAQRQAEAKQAENDSHAQWLAQKQREAQPPPQEPFIDGRKAERLDVKGLADALRNQGKPEEARHFDNMAEKAQQPLQRQVRPPETK